MKLVKDDLACRVWNVSLGGSNIAIPHVHGCCLDTVKFLGSEPARVLLKAFLLPIIGYVLHRPPITIAYTSLVTVTLGKRLLVDTQPGRNSPLFSGKPSGDSLLHDMPSLIPAGPRQTLGPRNVAFLEGVDYPTLSENV